MRSRTQVPFVSANDVVTAVTSCSTSPRTGLPIWSGASTNVITPSAVNPAESGAPEALLPLESANEQENVGADDPHLVIDRSVRPVPGPFQETAHTPDPGGSSRTTRRRTMRWPAHVPAPASDIRTSRMSTCGSAEPEPSPWASETTCRPEFVQPLCAWATRL